MTTVIDVKYVAGIVIVIYDQTSQERYTNKILKINNFNIREAGKDVDHAHLLVKELQEHFIICFR